MLEIDSWNRKLSLIDDSDHLIFDSLSGNPIIFFKEIYFDDSKNYEFSIDFFSSVESYLQLYYTTIFDSKFSEIKSYKKNVVIGRNRISISLKELSLGRKLRLDPLSTIGRIEVYNMSLSVINEEKLSGQKVALIF